MSKHENKRRPQNTLGEYDFRKAKLIYQVVNKWILFQQIVGPEPLKCVILLYINEGYEYEGGPPAGAACEIIVGINWNIFNPIIQKQEWIAYRYY